MGGEILGTGLVGNLAHGAIDAANQLVCSLLKANFLRIFLTDNHCLNEISLPSALQTEGRFCDFFNNCSPSIQKCLNDAAIETAFDYGKKYGRGSIDISTCCAHHLGTAREIKLPQTATKYNC